MQQPIPDNPIVRAAAFIVAALIITGAFFIGTFVIIALAGLVFITMTVFYIRLWWLRRHMQRTARRKSGHGITIEGEYSVRDERRPEDRNHG